MSQMEVVEHRRCRLCGNENLTDVHNFGSHYVSNFVDREDISTGLKAPLDLVICDHCSLIQLRHTAPMELMYARHYWYRSGVTATMREGLRDIAVAVENIVSLNDGDVVLDIGANDGTFLANFKDRNVTTVGCEPANNLTDLLRDNVDVVINDFWSAEAFDAAAKTHGFGKAKVITALGMFYDLEDPSAFIADVAASLAEGGLFVAQLMCLKTMLDQNDLGNICHEHLEYYSLDSLKYLFENNGLEMIKIEENDINGGSYRIFCRHFSGHGMDYDEKTGMDDLRAFVDRIDRNRAACVEFIREEVARGKTVYVYGASTKGNTILQYYGLDHTLITAAAERSPEKWGKFTIGTGIPIVSEDEARAAQPDYFLVLPWAFFSEFYEREKAWRDAGGKFIVPLPDFRVVD
jgi:NDP-4-keto-2,6-dideoxyhexose 3-C-methyltransferase